MSDELQPLFNDAGEQVAWVGEADDGAIVALDDDGTVLAAQTPDGEPLDASEYAYTGGEEAYDDEFEQRLADVEQRLEQPRQVEYVEADDGDDYDPAADLTLQVDHAEQILDRPLTLAEKRAVFREAQAELVSGRDPDIGAIAERLADMDEPIADLDAGGRGQRHQSRVDFIVGRLGDQERVAAHQAGEDDISQPEPPRSQEDYDDDSHAERTSYVVDRMRGAAAPENLYSSSDQEEWE